MSKKCTNCGWEKPKLPKLPSDDEKEIHCSICDENIKRKDMKEHKKSNIHNIKNDLINNLVRYVKELDPKDEEDNKKINKLSKTITPKYKPVIDNKNTVE